MCGSCVKSQAVCLTDMVVVNDSMYIRGSFHAVPFNNSNKAGDVIMKCIAIEITKVFFVILSMKMHARWLSLIATGENMF